MAKVADAVHAQMIVMATVFAKAWRNSQRTTFHLIYMKILLLNTIVHGMQNTVMVANVMMVSEAQIAP